MIAFYRRRLMSLLAVAVTLEDQPRSLGWTTYDREEILWTALRFVSGSRLQGDYAEFGVWRGDTFATAIRFAQRLSKIYAPFKEMKFHAFDSFEGFPELKGADRYPQFETGGRSYGLEQFYARIDKYKVSRERVTANKGWFSDTLQPGGEADRLIPDQSLTLVYMDADLYESTRDVLPFVRKKAKSGAVIIFDNWFLFAGHPLKGEQKATREFLKEHPEVVFVPYKRFGWCGQSFVYHVLDDEQQQAIHPLSI